jgi:hypothetical protein
MTDLDVEKEQRIFPLRPPVHLLDQCGVHARPIHAIAARGALGDHSNQMQRGLHRRRWISLLPRRNGLIELREHFIDGILAQDAHLFYERVSIECDDSFRGKIAPASGAGPVGHVGNARRPARIADW